MYTNSQSMPHSDTLEEFHRLIKKGAVIAIRELLASGADANIRNQFGWTPLMFAADAADTPIVRLLLSAGADVQAVNNFGASALAYAALCGACPTIQVLLDAGASLEVHPHGVSLLDFAGRGKGRFETRKHFELLRAAGAK